MEQQGDFYRIRVGGRIEGWSAQIYLRENTQASEMRSTTEFPPNQQSTTVETWSKEKQSSLRRVGQCTDTQIAEISGRLQGEPDSGTVIGYTNGVYGVSYQVIQEIRRSRVGDLVRLCLTSIPRDCPKGDDRGKTYRAVNLRTGASWELADSSHMCGGA